MINGTSVLRAFFLLMIVDTVMAISPALAHGTSGAETPAGGIGLLIIVAVATLIVLVLVAEKKLRARKQRRDGSGK